MNSRTVATAAILTSLFVFGSIPYIMGAAVVTPRYQAVSGAAVVVSQGSLVSMLWLLGDDGKVKVCKGTDAPTLTLTCSPAVAP